MPQLPDGSFIPTDVASRVHAATEPPPPPKRGIPVVFKIAFFGVLGMAVIGGLLYSVISLGVRTPLDMVRLFTPEEEPMPVVSVLGTLSTAPRELYFSESGDAFAAITDDEAESKVTVLGAQFSVPLGTIIDEAAWSPADPSRYSIALLTTDRALKGTLLINDGVLQNAAYDRILDMAWSPEGSTLAIAAIENGSFILISNGVKVTPANLPPGSTLSGHLAWSKNGRHLAYLMEEPGSFENILVVDGRVVRTIPKTTGGLFFNAEGTLYAGACGYTVADDGAVTSKGCLANAVLMGFSSEKPVYAVPEDDRYPASPVRASLILNDKRVLSSCQYSPRVKEECFEVVTWSADGSAAAFSEQTATGSVLSINGLIEPFYFKSIDDVTLSGNGRHSAYAAKTESGAAIVLNNNVVAEDTSAASGTQPFHDLAFSPEGIHFGYLADRLDASTTLPVMHFILDGESIASYDHIEHVMYDEPNGRVKFNARKGTEILHVDLPIPARSFVTTSAGRALTRSAVLAISAPATGLQLWTQNPVRWSIENLPAEVQSRAVLRFDIYSPEAGRVYSTETRLSAASGTSSIFFAGLVPDGKGNWRNVSAGQYRLQATVYDGASPQGDCAVGNGGTCTYALISDMLRNLSNSTVAAPRVGTIALTKAPLAVLAPEGIASEGYIKEGDQLKVRWSNPGGGSVNVEFIAAKECADLLRCPAKASIHGDLPNIGFTLFTIPSSMSTGAYFIRMSDYSRKLTVVSDAPFSVGTTPVAKPAPKPTPKPTPKPIPDPPPTPGTTGGASGTTGTTGSTIQTVATPSISPAGGSFTDYKAVTMSVGTAGATIRYTIDGSVPTESSAAYSTTVYVSQTMTIKAKAFKSGMTPSAVKTVTFTKQASGTTGSGTTTGGGSTTGGSTTGGSTTGGSTTGSGTTGGTTGGTTTGGGITAPPPPPPPPGI